MQTTEKHLKYVPWFSKSNCTNCCRPRYSPGRQIMWLLLENLGIHAKYFLLICIIIKIFMDVLWPKTASLYNYWRWLHSLKTRAGAEIRCDWPNFASPPPSCSLFGVRWTMVRVRSHIVRGCVTGFLKHFLPIVTQIHIDLQDSRIFGVNKSVITFHTTPYYTKPYCDQSSTNPKKWVLLIVGTPSKFGRSHRNPSHRPRARL